jgi:hypothetical protein
VARCAPSISNINQVTHQRKNRRWVEAIKSAFKANTRKHGRCLEGPLHRVRQLRAAPSLSHGDHSFTQYVEIEQYSGDIEKI